MNTHSTTSNEGWQDIATAPKDGTTVQLRQGRWAPYHGYYNWGWQSIEYSGSHYPTHWRPRPAPSEQGK